MLPALILVFLAVFILVAAVLGVLVVGATQDPRQVRAALDSALAGEHVEAREQIDSFRRTSQLSSIPWLNRNLHKLELTPYLQKMIAQADVKMTVGKLLLISAGAFILPAYLVYLRLNMTLVAVAIGGAFACFPYMWVMRKRNARMDKFQEGLPEALDLVVNALRAGHSLVLATGIVARECAEPVSGEFRTCFEEQNYGLDMKTALDNMLDRVPLQDLRIVATAIMIQKDTGGNLAEVLDKAAHSIRERFRLKREIKTHTAQGRMTGWILGLLPVVVGVLMFFVNPEMMRVLWTDPLGVKLMWIAVVMTIVGGLIIRQIVNMEV